MRLLAALAALVLAAPLAGAQALWTDVSDASLRPAPGARVTTPSAYRLVRLDVPQMAERLDGAPDEGAGPTLTVPLPDGTFATVRVTTVPTMAPELQARYPEIRTYAAQGEGSVSGRLSLTPAGFRGLLFTPEGTVYLDPYARGDAEHLVVYYGRDLSVDPAERGSRADDVDETGAEAPGGPSAARANGATLRTYRLAMAATGEYTQFHGGTKPAGLAAIAATMNRVNGLYERDLSVRMVLVANNDAIVYTNPATDPYTNVTNGAALTTNRTNLNNVVGSANYDIGHLVATGGGGIASLGSVCTSSKAQGTTGLPQPVGDAFDVDYVAHEIGHQFRGNHTFNGSVGACAGGNRNATTAVEPGSGTTIMAYAGICANSTSNQNLQNNSDALFHAISLDEITAFVTTGAGATCGSAAATGNPIPTVTAPAAFTIPVGTPFALMGAATDDTPQALTYAWEETDAGTVAGAPGSATPPLFRSFLPSDSPTRVFPQLARLVAGLPPVKGETLPTTDQTLTFRLTARDNRPGGGAINDATTRVTATTLAGPFAVTFASTANQTYAGTATVTWTVAGTNAGAVATPTVDILLSTDNGATFSTVLASATPNDGSELVSFPVSTTQGRIMVRAVGNVFFNVNPQRFTATAAQQLVSGRAGWRMLAPAAPGLTVDDLAAVNLVQGVPGYYPAAAPNLLTGYDGTGFTTSGTGAPLASGQGLFWYFYDQAFAPGGPSQSRALPTALSTPRAPRTADTPVLLRASGDGANLLGNPFGTSLDVSEASVAAWSGAANLASLIVQVWNPNAGASGSYESSLVQPTLAPWQGFFAEAQTAGALTIPASARTTGGTLLRPDAAPLVAFELSSADGHTDRAAILTLRDDASDGRDLYDASKLAPPAEAAVLVAFGDAEALRSVESRPVAPVSVPVSVASVGAGADLVLTWPRVEALPEGWAAVLRDRETGAVVDLSARDSYAFTVVPTASRTAGTLPAHARATGLAARFDLTVGPRGAVASEAGAAAVLALDAPRPNPARGAAEVAFSLAEAGAVRLSVVDLLGREVAVMVAGERPAGRHAEALDAARLAPGVYVVRLAAGGQALARRLVVVR